MKSLLRRPPQRIDITGTHHVLLRQHLFEQPVAQEKMGRRVADRSGLKLWPCALPLLRHLLAEVVPDLGAALGRAPRVLELGSGVGLLGIGLGVAGGCDVTLTDPALATRFAEHDADRATTLDWLAANVALNGAAGGRCAARRLVWGDAADAAALAERGPFDLVVGADLLYESAHYAALAAALDAFAPADGAGPAAVLGYAHRVGGERRFFADVAADRFAATTAPLGGTKGGASVTALRRRKA